MTMEKESTIPGFFRRRELLEEKQPSKDTLRTLGSELAAQGLLDESLAFFVKAEDREGVERVLKESRQQRHLHLRSSPESPRGDGFTGRLEGGRRRGPEDGPSLVRLSCL
jgi:hypothetical protein